MAKYMKAAAFAGKNLTLGVGRGDKKILDGVVYNDPRLAKFVKLGFLVEVDEDLAPKPAPVVVSKPKPKVVQPVESPKATPKKYKKTNLSKRNRQVLIRLAANEFGLKLDPGIKKPAIVEAILKAQG